MAIVPVGRASVQMIDSANKDSSASFRVSVANAQAYIAAADQTARDGTDVGLLLNSALNISRAAGTNNYRKYDVGVEYMNDQAIQPSEDAGIYRSNKWKVTGRTTNNGVPALDTVYVPEYLITGVVMESDGISANIDDEPMLSFVAEFISTALSKYGTAFTSVVSVQRNDT